jgi:hypothetical protein
MADLGVSLNHPGQLRVARKPRAVSPFAAKVRKVVKIATVVALVWKLARHIPVLGDFLRTAEGFVRGFLTSVGYVLTGKKILDPTDPLPPGNVECPCQLPVSAYRVVWPADKIAVNHDVTRRLASVLLDLAPAWIQYADDAPPVTHPELRKKSDFDGEVFDFHRDWVRDRSSQGVLGRKATLRAYVVEASAERIWVELRVGLLRAVSYWGCPGASDPLVWEHDADGESPLCLVEVRKVPGKEGATSPEPPQDPLSAGTLVTTSWALARLVAIATAVHSRKGVRTVATWREMHLGADGRPSVRVARGSHALHQRPGVMWIPKFKPFASERFPADDEEGAVRSRNFLIERTPEEAAEVHRGRVWGKKKIPGTHCYDVWKPGPDMKWDPPILPWPMKAEDTCERCGRRPARPVGLTDLTDPTVTSGDPDVYDAWVRRS